MYGQIDLIKLILPIFKIKNGSIKFDLSSQEIELSFETQSHMGYFFSANFHLMSHFYRGIIRKILNS